MMKKNILVGVTGGIAAYKACDLVSRLTKHEDMEVRVMITKSAAKFVSPITFEALCHHKVETDLFDETNEDPIAHITLANWCDLVILVPATANSIAKVVHGISDDLVSTTFLACHGKKIICPAMNVHMMENPVTVANIERAKQLGYIVMEPVTGHLACNDVGKGKLPAVEDIEKLIVDTLQEEQILKGKHVLVSAGPTQEALDPVRYITNHSSGKQGYAIAKAAVQMGAKVTLVSGPVSLAPVPGAEMVSIRSARDMYDAIISRLDQVDYIIMAAAIADYRPAEVADQKIKKSGDDMTITLVRNPDILATIGERKRDNQIVCGFAMETQDLDKNASEKLKKKNCDMLIGNNLNTEGAGFGTDTNVVTLVKKDSLSHLPKCTKEELGVIILKTMKEIEDQTC